jgi:hypothetical protein
MSSEGDEKVAEKRGDVKQRCFPKRGKRGKRKGYANSVR